MTTDRFNDYSALSKPTSAAAVDVSSSNARETLSQHAFDYPNTGMPRELSSPLEASQGAGPTNALSFTDIMKETKSLMSFQKNAISDVFHGKANAAETGTVLMDGGLAVVATAGAILAAPEIFGLASAATVIGALDGMIVATNVGLGGMALSVAGAGIMDYDMSRNSDR